MKSRMLLDTLRAIIIVPPLGTGCAVAIEGTMILAGLLRRQ